MMKNVYYKNAKEMLEKVCYNDDKIMKNIWKVFP